MRKACLPEILVAASDATTREYLDRMLRTFGYPVTTARTFHDARACVLTGWPDILISDIRLGDFNGLHLGWLRHFTDPGRPTIITHMLFDPALEAEARKLGAPYVVMPTGTHQLVTLVDRMFETSRRPKMSPTPPAVMNAKRRQGHLYPNTHTPISQKVVQWRHSTFQS